MDPLAELAYDFTPYRYGFKNPVFFGDASGLFETYIEAINFLSVNNKSGIIKPHINGGYYVTIVGGEFDGEKFYYGASMLETMNLKSSGGDRSGGPSKSENTKLNSKDNGFGINFTTTTGGSDGPVKPRNGGRYTFTILADIIMLYADIFGPNTKVGVDIDAIQALNQQKNQNKMKEKDFEIESDEEYLAKKALIKIERPQYQQEFIFKKTDKAIRRPGFDTIINKKDYPSILKKFESDSLKHIK